MNSLTNVERVTVPDHIFRMAVDTAAVRDQQAVTLGYRARVARAPGELSNNVFGICAEWAVREYFGLDHGPEWANDGPDGGIDGVIPTPHRGRDVSYDVKCTRHTGQPLRFPKSPSGDRLRADAYILAWWSPVVQASPIGRKDREVWLRGWCTRDEVAEWRTLNDRLPRPCFEVEARKLHPMSEWHEPL